MRKKLLVALALSAMLVGGVASIASASKITVRGGNLVATFGGNVLPVKLPKRRYAPIGLRVFGNIQTSDGTHPSAFREARFMLDRNGRIDTRGVPVCRGSQLEARNTAAARRVCGRALVGKGNAAVQIAFPEQEPIQVPSPLLIFNGGTRGGKTTMYIHSFITVPVPAAIVTTLTIQRIKKGRFGYYVIARIPRIVGGNGSAMRFNFTIDRQLFRFRGRRHPYLSARCTDGRFFSRLLQANFFNEKRTPGVAAKTTLKGNLVVPCRSRGR